MTFEKALEAMKQGKKVRREFWDQNVCIGIDNTHIIRNMTYDDKFHTYEYCMPTEFLSRDLLADDWEIHEPKTWYNSVEPGYNCRCEINPDILKNIEIESGKALTEWLEKASKRAEERAKQCKPFETYKEETTMYTDLEITFKSGETITYKEGEWDDYSYDGKSVAVKKSGAWVGLYNFDNVFCVELKKREG